MIQMNLPNFTNRLRSLFNIDYNRLPEMPEDLWPSFRDDPVRFFITCDDEMRAAIWREVQHRCWQHDRYLLEVEDRPADDVPPALRLEIQRDLDGAVRHGKVFGEFLDSMLSPKAKP